MLFRILRLFGLDVPAKIEAAKASLELRVERASERAKEVAQASAVIVVLAAFASVALGMASVVGLIALYRIDEPPAKVVSAIFIFIGIGSFTLISNAVCQLERPTRCLSRIGG
jgi:hypothetical protein